MRTGSWCDFIEQHSSAQDAFERENVPENLVDAITRCDAGMSEALENLCRAAACLACWGGAMLRSLSQPNAVKLPFKILREWSSASREPIPIVQEEEVPKTPQKGKKPATPTVEEPQAPGPPFEALVGCIRWVCVAVHGSHHAAAAACEISADHFINLLKHPSPAVINASLKLFNALLRLQVLHEALVTVRDSCIQTSRAVCS